MAAVNDELQLIRDVVARQPTAEEEFVRRYRGFVHALARGRLALRGEAVEELWQETMAGLWRDDCRALRSWRGRGRFTTYLTVIVTHLAWRQRRQSRPEEGMDQLAAEPALDEPSAEERLARHQARRRVRQALSTLSPRDRLLLALRFADERTPKEMALLLGQAPGTVRKAVHDALRRLHKRLTPEKDGPLP